MKGYIFYIVLIALSLFIYITEEASFNVFTIWNMLPLIISLAIYKLGHKQGTKTNIYGAYGFLIGCMLLTGYIHLAWFFDWEGTKTASSTAGLIFIFIPIYSLIPGGIGYFIGRGIASDKKT